MLLMLGWGWVACLIFEDLMVGWFDSVKEAMVG